MSEIRSVIWHIKGWACVHIGMLAYMQENHCHLPPKEQRMLLLKTAYEDNDDILLSLINSVK